MRRRLPLFLASSLLVFGTACDGLFGADLPGGSAKGETYELVAEFDDVLDLVPQSAVRVGDVAVGDVDEITLDQRTFKARVVMSIKTSVKLPRNATARVRQTSLLGEKFVELAQPQVPHGELRDGDTIVVDNTSRVPEVEEVFTALSALLNGGGIGNLQEIAVELSAAMAGREDTIRSALGNITQMVTALDQRKADIVRAIDALDRLTATLAKQRQTIGEALDTFTPALTVLADQREDLTRLLTHVAELGRVSTRVVNASREDAVRNFQLLQPILERVVSAKTDLSQALDQVLLLTKLVPRAIPGDYLQLYVEIYLDPNSHGPTAPGKPAPAKGAAPAAKRPVVTPPAQPALPPPTTGAALDWLLQRGLT